MTVPTPEPTPTPEPPKPAPTYTPPASQADLDRIVSERLARERGKFADYDDLKTKASKLDQIEAANKTELEKERDRAAAAEARAVASERKALLAQIAAEKGVPASSLTGATEDEMRKSADDLIAWKGDAPAPTPPPSGKPTENLRGGGDPDDSPAVDMRKIVESIPRGFN